MWSEYEEAGQKYIHLQAPNVHAKQAYRASKVDFWLNWLPELTDFSQCDEDGEGLDECGGVVLGGDVDLTPSEAGDLIIILLLVLAVVGLLCILLLTATCGYRQRAKALWRALTKDVEMGEKSSGKASESLPSTIAVTVPLPTEDLPPPPPPSPPMDTDDTKPLIPDSPTPSEHQAPSTAFETDNPALDDDEEVRQALNDMDTVVENADTASVDLTDAGTTSDPQKEETDQVPKVEEEKEEGPKSEDPAVEDDVPQEKDIPKETASG